MKSRLNDLLLLPTLFGCFALMPAGRMPAQTLTVLHHFDLFTEGGQPAVTEALTFSGDTLYGATYMGGLNGVNGAAGKGTLFSIKTNGATFSVIHAFAAPGADGTNPGGELPVCTLKLVGTKLYGTATSGGSLGNGVLYSVNTDGTDFTTLFNFSGAPLNSSYAKHSPLGELVLSGETLYGLTVRGGSPDYDGSVNGRIFAINTNGTGTFPYAFPSNTWDGGHLYSPYGPYGGLVLRDNRLYGVTLVGGYDDYGTVFAVNIDGSGYSTLHSFTNLDGATPLASLVLSGDTLYGTTTYGGSQGRGVIYSINVAGSGFTVLHTFNLTEGYTSQSALIVSGDTLYGSTVYGGSTGYGTVFSMKTDGTEYTVLHSLDRYPEGAFPTRLILAGGSLYGMASSGGRNDKGTIFRLSLPGPQLTVTLSGADSILSWPTNATGFTLESTTNLVSVAIWSAVSPAPVVVNGRNTVTNLVSGTKKFYRLNQ